jgi:two-component system, chemotaxis family, sensor kinase Cph1
MASLDFISQVKARINSLTDPGLEFSNLRLTNCDREPIHVPNAIQSHGVLLTFSEADLIILQISQNTQVLLGRQPEALLGQSLETLISHDKIEAIQSCLKAEFDTVNPVRLMLSVDGHMLPFEGIVHRSDRVIVLELEPVVDAQAVNFFDFYKSVKLPIDCLQGTNNLTELALKAVTVIRKITGFDRVVLYRFDPDGSGHVIAEDKQEALESFLGLHYPASDIPKQAKELYKLNLLRIIPDTLCARVALQPALNPLTEGNSSRGGMILQKLVK